MTRPASARRRSCTRVLYDIAQVLAAVDVPDDRLRRVLDLLRDVVPFDVCALLDTQPARESRILVEPEPPLDRRAEIVATVEGLFAGQVAERAGEAPGAPARGSARGTLAVPLLWNADAIGILFVRRAPGGYSESHLRTLTIVSGQLAAFLSMRRAQRQAREADPAPRAAQAADNAKDGLIAVLSQRLKDPVSSTLAWAHALVVARADQPGPVVAAAAIERNARLLAKVIDEIQALTCVASAELHLDLRATEQAHGLKTTIDGLREPGSQASSSSVAGAIPTSMPSRGAVEHEPGVLHGIDVLLVDDDQDIQEAFQLVLEIYGATVTAVGSAAAAMTAIARSRPDVLLCDISMPGENGYELMKRIAARDPELPAAALSAFADLAERGRARAAGFRMQLAKPIEAARLVAVVLELAGRPSAEGAALRLSAGA